MASRRPWLGMIILLPLAGCAWLWGAAPYPLPDAPTDDPAPPEGRPIAFGTVHESSGSSSGETGRGAFVITERTAWEHLWNRVHEGKSFVPPLPEIDFAKEMIIAVFQGGGTGSRIRITQLVEMDRGLVVMVRESFPGPDCIVAQVITYEFDIIRTARNWKVPIFRLTHEVYDCDT